MLLTAALQCKLILVLSELICVSQLVCKLIGLMLNVDHRLLEFVSL